MADKFDWKTNAIPVGATAPPVKQSWRDTAIPVSGIHQGPDVPLGQQLDDMASEGAGGINAAVNSAANAGSFGLVHPAEGATTAAIKATQEYANSGQIPDLQSLQKYYNEGEQNSRQAEALSAKHFPVPSMVGGGAGAFMAPLPGGKIVSPVLRYLKGAATGAAVGGLTDPTSGMPVADRLRHALYGAGLGTVAEKLASSIEAAPIPNWMTAKQLGANTQQLKGMLKELPEAAQRGDETTRIEQIRKFMDDNGMLNMGTHFSDVADQSGQMMKESGEGLAKAHAAGDEAAAALPAQHQAALAPSQINGGDVADEFLASEAQRLADTPQKKTIMKQLTDEFKGDPADPNNMGSLQEMGDNISLSRLWKYRKALDENINFAAKAGNATLQRSYTNLRNLLNDKIAGRATAIDGLAGTNVAPEISALNKTYSDSALVNKITTNTTAREMSKYAPGLVGTMVGGGVTFDDYNRHGSSLPTALLKGVAAGLATRGIRAIAPAMTYRAFQSLPENLGPRMTNEIMSPWAQMQEKTQ